MGLMDLLVVVLSLAGGGAVGAALGGGLMGALAWTGARLKLAITGAAVIGASAAWLIAGGGVSASALSGLAQIHLGLRSDSDEMGRVLKTYYPSDYQAAQAQMTTLRATGASPAQMQAAMAQLGAPLILRQLPLASTDNAMAYLKLTHAEQAFLESRPALCYEVMM